MFIPTIVTWVAATVIVSWQLFPSARSQTMKDLVNNIQTVNTKMVKISNFSLFSLKEEVVPELRLDLDSLKPLAEVINNSDGT